jgi:ribonuclease R
MINTKTLLRHIQSESPKTIDQWIEFFNYHGQDVESFKGLIHQLKEDYVLGETKKHKLYAIHPNSVIRGKVWIKSKDEAVLKTDEEDVSIAISALAGALHQDEVIALRLNQRDVQVVRITQRKLESFSVKVHQKQILALQERIPYPMKLTQDFNPHWVDGTILHVKPIQYDGILKVDVLETVGYLYDPGVDITARLIDYQIPLKFSENIQEEVQHTSMQVLDQDKIGRIDYSSELVFTIDGEDARDFDDAISIHATEEGYRLCVHIADVSHYVQAHSALDEEAQNRGTSIYLLDRVVPMLPQALSNGICSLVEQEERLTITCRMDLDAQGLLKDYDIHPSWIISKKRMTYTQVNAFLDQDEQAYQALEPFAKALEDLSHCAQALRKQREKMGMLDFESSESKFILDENNRILRIEARIQDEAEQIIEDCMIIANQVVASHMQGLSYPCVYRVHGKPDKTKLMEFINVARFFNIKLHPKKLGPHVLQRVLDEYRHKDLFVVLNNVLLRSMKKAVYDHRCEGHYGLGLDHYCHFTSPIRRYPDLIVHRMLRKYVFNHQYEEMDDDLSFVEVMGHECSFTERRAMDVERDVESMKKAEYMAAYIGEVYPGIITSIVPYGFYVRLENTVEGLVHVRTLDGFYEYDSEHYVFYKKGTKKRFTLGQKLRIRVVSADKNRRSVDFEVV